MMKIIDGDRKMPGEIAEELGFSGVHLDDKELRDMVQGVLEQNNSIVDKIIKSGKEGPIKALVGNTQDGL